MASNPVPFSDLEAADLVVGTVYEGGCAGNAGDDPIHPLIRVGNQGGIRFRGSADECRIAGLASFQDHPAWPDRIDGRVMTYFGDNERAGQDLVKPRGNQLLRALFRRGFGDEKNRLQSPPFFVFTKADEPGSPSRSVRFEGVAVPGARTVPAEDWLTAKWFSGPYGRFENYVVILTILDIGVASRRWIDEIIDGEPAGTHCPAPFRRWLEDGMG